MRRTGQRRAAVIAVYQHDLTARPLADVLPADAGAFTRALAVAAIERAPELDELIGRHARGWTVARIAPLERAILRVALVEMLHGDEVPADVPIAPEGAIDEAVETTKLFCAADAAGFVNGVLDAILREVRENEARAHA
jgi:N utilization substance protein B